MLDRLFASPYYAAAQSISCYVSTPSGEVQTDSLILRALDEGKRIYIPYCPIDDKTKMLMLRLRDKRHFEGLKENRWGIRELDPSEVRLDERSVRLMPIAELRHYFFLQVGGLEDGPPCPSVGVAQSTVLTFSSFSC